MGQINEHSDSDSDSVRDSAALYRTIIFKLLTPCGIRKVILGVVHNCQHLPISTESTNLGEGG